MKELDSFTVERLEELSTKENIPEVAALARIALAAKRVEPAIIFNEPNSLAYRNLIGNFPVGTKFYTTPQLNPPQGWIKCSDQMPENSNIQCFVYCKDSLRRTGYFDGDDWAINGKYYDESFVTHWQKFPAAPEKENG